MDGKEIAAMVNGVTKTWAKKRKAEERSSRAPRRYYYSDRVTVKDAAASVMEAAYMKASGGGKLPANARQVMYAARGGILELTGRDGFDDAYFTQTLLPDYVKDHPEKTAGWRIVYDARGNFYEPHTDNAPVRLGTLEVDDHLASVKRHKVTPFTAELTKSSTTYPTKGPRHRYGAILFVEKEGFWPILNEAGIARKFDLAMLSTKGESVVASRALIDSLCGEHGIPLLVMHDFDVAGFNIAAVLGRDNRRYEWCNEIEPIDLGLRLADVEEWGLDSEPVKVRVADRRQLRRNGASDDEIEFLCSGQRVELNALSSDQLIQWLEGKLEEHGVKKVIPDSETLEDAYRRASKAHYIEKKLAEIEEEAEDYAEDLDVPGDLSERVAEALVDSAQPWDTAVADIAEGAA